jgi:hypothetical protein
VQPSLKGRAAGAALAFMVLGACAGGGPGAATPRVTEWSFGATEHLALWYHGLALAHHAVRDERPASLPLPHYRPGYADSIAAAKQAAGVAPTRLDSLAAEFGRAFVGQTAYDAIEFLPLYFLDSSALFAAVRAWQQAGGEARNARTPDAHQAISFLSQVFPAAEQRQLVGRWAEVLEEEARVFFRGHWERQFLRLRQTARDVDAEWRPIAAGAQRILASHDLQGGEAFLVPALGAEGRIVARGAGLPRVAVQAPAPGEPQETVYAFIHELLYPMIGDLVRQQVASHPAGPDERRLGVHAAVRGGALLLESAAPARLPEYRRFYMREAGHGDATDAAAFAAAFPLPGELETALRDMLQRPLPGG